MDYLGGRYCRQREEREQNLRGESLPGTLEKSKKGSVSRHRGMGSRGLKLSHAICGQSVTTTTQEWHG